MPVFVTSMHQLYTLELGNGVMTPTLDAMEIISFFR